MEKYALSLLQMIHFINIIRNLVSVIGPSCWTGHQNCPPLADHRSRVVFSKRPSSKQCQIYEIKNSCNIKHNGLAYSGNDLIMSDHITIISIRSACIEIYCLAKIAFSSVTTILNWRITFNFWGDSTYIDQKLTFDWIL